MAKKVSPGVGVVAYIPLPSKSTMDDDGHKSSTTTYTELVRIMPSFYSGKLIPGLTAAAYADIGVTKLVKNEVGTDSSVYYIDDEAKVPMDFALGANYAIPVDEMIITPKFGVRFANAAYVDYATEKNGRDSVKNPVFDKMGAQKTDDVDEYGITSDGNYMNLKLGVDVAGLVDNTTLSVTWQTANILNAIDYADKTHGPKLGTLNFKANISL